MNRAKDKCTRAEFDVIVPLGQVGPVEVFRLPGASIVLPGSVVTFTMYGDLWATGNRDDRAGGRAWFQAFNRAGIWKLMGLTGFPAPLLAVTLGGIFLIPNVEPSGDMVWAIDGHGGNPVTGKLFLTADKHLALRPPALPEF